jgi:F-type H+-transporting ATPase subunit b
VPQIAQILETYASQAFWLLIVFGLLYFGIARAMLPKIDATVDARDRKIAEDLAAAEKARTAAVNLESEYQADLARVRAGAQAEAAKAKAKAQMDAANRLAKADGELAAKTAEAEAAIAASRTSALAGIESVAAESAQAIAAKVAGLNVPAADAAKAVKAVLNG